MGVGAVHVACWMDERNNTNVNVIGNMCEDGSQRGCVCLIIYLNEEWTKAL